MALEGMLTSEALRKMVEGDEVDTVLVMFTDSYGRFMGKRVDARFFLDSIDESLKWIDTVGRYNTDDQREEVRDLFRRGREVYAELEKN